LKTLKHILPLEWQFSLPALEKASKAIFGVDANANIYRVTQAACRYLGYSREELTKQRYLTSFASRQKRGNTAHRRLPPTISNAKGKIIFAFVRNITVTR
jgi:PAS domain-containing protein